MSTIPKSAFDRNLVLKAMHLSIILFVATLVPVSMKRLFSEKCNEFWLVGWSSELWLVHQPSLFNIHSSLFHAVVKWKR